MKGDSKRYVHVLTVKELQKALNFAKDFDQDSVELIITPTGLGNCVTVRERSRNNEPYMSQDITDSDSW